MMRIDFLQYKTEIIDQTVEYVVFKLNDIKDMTSASLIVNNSEVSGTMDKVNATLTVNVSDIKVYYDNVMRYVRVKAYYGTSQQNYFPTELLV